jgi:hypothetical protein
MVLTQGAGNRGLAASARHLFSHTAAAEGRGGHHFNDFDAAERRWDAFRPTRRGANSKKKMSSLLMARVRDNRSLSTVQRELLHLTLAHVIYISASSGNLNDYCFTSRRWDRQAFCFQAFQVECHRFLPQRDRFFSIISGGNTTIEIG